jgi:hypothetical protein
MTRKNGLSTFEVLCLIDAYTNGDIAECQLLEALQNDCDSNTIDIDFEVIQEIECSFIAKGLPMPERLLS